MNLLTYNQIKIKAEPKDYAIIAELRELEVDTVRKVVAQKRKDKHFIRECFTILLKDKEEGIRVSKVRIREFLKEHISNIQ